MGGGGAMSFSLYEVRLGCVEVELGLWQYKRKKRSKKYKKAKCKAYKKWWYRERQNTKQQNLKDNWLLTFSDSFLNPLSGRLLYHWGEGGGQSAPSFMELSRNLIMLFLGQHIALYCVGVNYWSSRIIMLRKFRKLVEFSQFLCEDTILWKFLNFLIF